jgi:hypothetical protein
MIIRLPAEWRATRRLMFINFHFMSLWMIFRGEAHGWNVHGCSLYELIERASTFQSASERKHKGKQLIGELE